MSFPKYYKPQEEIIIHEQEFQAQKRWAFAIPQNFR